MSCFENFLIKVVRGGLYFFIAVLPFVITPWTIYPFIFGKMLFLQAIVVLLFAFYIPLALLAPKYRPKLSPLTVVLACYFLILFVAAIFGVDFHRSFWGTEERGTGLITLLHLALFYIMARSIFKGPDDQRRLLRVVVVSGIGLSVIALARLWGYKLFGVELGFRLSGTLANPIFFASVLIFNIFFASLLVTSEKNAFYKIFFAFIAIAQTIMLFATQTRGAFVGLAAAVLVILFSAMRHGKSTNRMAAATLLILIFAGSVMVWFNRDAGWVRRFQPLHRLTTISTKDTTAGTRIMAWQVAAKSFAARPVLGWGPENFSYAFNQNYNPKFLEHGMTETWFDRPHNTIFEVANNVGILGLISYLGIFAVAIFELLRRRSLWGNQATLLVGLLAAYFIQNLFVFDTPSSLLLLFLTLAFVEMKTQNISEISGKLTASYKPVAVLALTLAFAAFLVFKTDIQPLQASAAMMDAVVRAADYGPRESLPHFILALRFKSPYHEETSVEFAKAVTRLLADKSLTNDEAAQFATLASAELKKQILKHRRNAYFYFLLGRLLTEAGAYDSQYLKEAQGAFDRAVYFSPNRQQILFGLAKLKIVEGNFSAAKEIYGQTVALAPQVGEAHWLYGIMLHDNGEREAAEAEFIETGKFGYVPHDLESMLILARAMVRIKDYERAAYYFETAVNAAPNRADLQAQLALSYFEAAKITAAHNAEDFRAKAKTAALKAVELDPSYRAEAEIFLKMIQ